jgi:aminopeptidase YwaD
MAVVLASLLAAQAIAQEKKLSFLPDDLLGLLNEEISGEEAFRHVVSLSGWPRNRPEKEYEDTFYEAQYVLERASDYYLENTQVEYFPWKYPCWDPITAELWLVAPEKKKITGLDTIHLCLVEFSKTTDVTAEIVFVGEGTSPEDYVRKDVAGKIVLSNGEENLVNHQAVHLRGALGFISYRSHYPDDYPDMVSWGGFLHPYNESQEKYTFGFMVSPRMGKQLKRLLDESKKVMVRAQIKSQLHPGKLDVVSSVIRGRELPDEEIMLMAHLFEYYYKQGANDNKSGSAVILETARIIRKLIKEGKIPPPKRSIRFFWEPEGWGTYAWLAKHPDESEKLKAVIDMDMVGESHQKCGSVFQVFDTPDSLPHFINDIVAHYAEYIAEKSGIGKNRATQKYSDLIASPTGSRDPFYHQIIHFNPRMYNENWIAVPHILFHCSPDPFYHSSEDRPDKCDPTQLKRAAFLGAAVALTLANLDSQDVPLLCALALGEGEKRLARDRENAMEILTNSTKSNVQDHYKEACNLVRQGFLRERSILASIGSYLRLSPEETEKLTELGASQTPSLSLVLENYYAYLCDLIGGDQAKTSISAVEKSATKVIPKRIKGLEYTSDFYYLERALNDKNIKNKLEIFKPGLPIPWELLNFVDGKRSVLDIRNALCAEFFPVRVTLKIVEDYLEILKKAGVVEIDRIK